MTVRKREAFQGVQSKVGQLKEFQRVLGGFIHNIYYGDLYYASQLKLTSQFTVFESSSQQKCVGYFVAIRWCEHLDLSIHWAGLFMRTIRNILGGR